MEIERERQRETERDRERQRGRETDAERHETYKKVVIGRQRDTECWAAVKCWACWSTAHHADISVTVTACIITLKTSL